MLPYNSNTHVKLDKFISAKGETTQLIRSYDWSATPLGPSEDWPQSLLTTLSIMSTSKIPMLLWWGDDHIQFYNDACLPGLLATGKHPIAIGQKSKECFHEIWNDIKPLIQKVWNDGEVIAIENHAIPLFRDEEWKDVHYTFSLTPVKEEIGKIGGILVIGNESKEKISALKNIEFSRLRFENLIRQSTVGIIVLLGEEWKVETVNIAYGKLINKTPEELLHRSLFSVIPEAEKDFKPIFTNILKTGEPLFLYGHPYFVVVNGERKEGFLDLIYQPYREMNGEITGVMVLCHDVTESVISRKKLEEEKDRTTLALEAGDLGLFEIEISTDDIITNKRFNDIFGFTSQPTRNEILQTYHPLDRLTRDKAVEEGEVTGVIRYETRIYHTDGSLHWIRLHSKRIYNDLGQHFRLHGIILDITAEKNTQEKLANASEELAGINEELRAANEEMAASNEELAESNTQLYQVNSDLDNFIYAASHDLKAPFNNIEGLLNTILREVELKPDLSELKNMIEISFQRFRKTLDHLTNITKLQKDYTNDSNYIKFEEVLSEAILDIQDDIKKSRAAISKKFEVPEIKFLEKNLRSILYNLVSNAIKYKSPDRDSEIFLKTYLREGFVVLEVVDNGLGISSDKLNYIFGMFKRAHDHVEGSGIGLYIVKKIIESMGGKIKVESELGKGSSFMVFFKNVL